MEPERKWLVIGAAIAVLCQIILAPNIVIGDAMPNFIVAYTVVVALVRAEQQHYVLAFVMGLTADLLGNGPVGATAFCLLIAVFAISFIVQFVGNDNLVMTCVVLFIVILGIDVVYAIFIVSTGAATFADAMIYRALPCVVYDSIIAILFYFLLARFTGGAASTSSPTSRHSAGSKKRKNPAPTPNIRFH